MLGSSVPHEIPNETTPIMLAIVLSLNRICSGPPEYGIYQKNKKDDIGIYYKN